MAFSFDVRLGDGDVAEKIEQVKQMARDSVHNIALEGDADSGSITGVVQGSYQVVADKLTVTIKRKPLVLSQGLVKQTIREFFS
jgi:predicted DNA-binding protein (MmcQ/YjbR family)